MMMGAPMPNALPKLPDLKPSVQTNAVSSVTKINAQKFKDSVWADIVSSSAVETAKDFSSLNLIASLEKNFSKSAKKDDDKPKEEKPEITSFLDGKLQSGLMILIGFLKLSHLQFRDAVLAMDVNVLKRNTVESLGKVDKDFNSVYPDDGTVSRMVQFFESTPELLNEADKLIVAMAAIPRQKERFMAWNFGLSLTATTAKLVADLQVLIDAGEQFLNSNAFKSVLSLTLNAVNVLNFHAKKQVHGFKLDFLSKIGDVKTTDKKSSLLQILCASLASSDKYNKLDAELLAEMLSVPLAMRFELNEITKEFKSLKDFYAIVAQEKGFLKDRSAEDKFPQFFTKLVEDTDASFKLLEDGIAKLNSVMKTIALVCVMQYLIC